jgi:septal ring factor EnvC (AmiA/AmiB activator)
MLQSLEEQLAKLTADFEQATAEKLCCQQEADATNATIQLANRLVGGLASENVRWAESVAKYVQLCFKLQVQTPFMKDILQHCWWSSFINSPRST